MPTALVVDDEAAIRGLFVKVLGVAGFGEVLTASNGAEGLAVWRENRGDISLVLTDLQMPVMDGQEMIKRMLGEDPGVKIIMVTGTPPEGGTPGARAIVTKPVNLGNLLTVIEAVMQT